MAGIDLYERTKKALGLAIMLVQLAIALSFLLFVFTLEDSFNLLSIIGILDYDRETGLWLVWPVIGFVIASLIVSQFIFIRRAKALFASEDNAIARFGTTTSSTSKSIGEVRSELNRYALIAIPLSVVIALFIRMPFVNVLLGATLSFILIVLFLFYRDNAKLLRCDEELLS